ncbi:MAG TPA: DUF2339 domain-containing protein [Lysobacter sp.]|nr:DUF2339 domain-containing protein [Lysobacter sp.]
MESLLVMLALAVLTVPVLLVVALVMLARLSRRVAVLEAQVASFEAPPRAAAAVEPTLDELVRAAPPPSPYAPPRAEPSPPPPSSHYEPAVPREPTPPPLPPRAPARPGTVEVVVRAARRWLTEGNVPVKVGMLVLFAGVAALLKHASDQGWLRLPIELRLSGVALAALAGLVFAWRQRERRRGFALAVQGGAVGVLLLTVFAAFKLYALIPAGAAFGLSIALVAALGVLAVAQNALALAVLGLLAGFLAPIWLSTGSGSHVALFGYYAVLNPAVFGIAWRRAWRILNVLGFAFTFGIGAAWGALRYRPEDFASTEPFLLGFFALYLLIPLLYARRRAPGRRDAIDGCLLFGTPLVAFSLQAGLLDGARLPLAFNALALGALYALLAAAVRRSERLAAFVAPYAVLAVGFATLAVPLALSAQATASVFALEGAGLVWLGLRQQRRLPQLSGALLQLASAVAFALGVGGELLGDPVANARFMAALLLTLAGFASAWSCHRHARAPLAALYYLWGLAWWLGNGVAEIDAFVAAPSRADALLAFAALTAVLAAEAFRRIGTRGLAWTAALATAAPLVLLWAQIDAHAQPFAGHGLAAWLAYAALGLRALHGLRDHAQDERTLAHLAWLAAWTLAVAATLDHAARSADLGQGWQFATLAVPLLALAAAAEWRPGAIALPFGVRFLGWRDVLRALLAVAFLLVAVLALFEPGSSAPLAYVPLLNPLDLVQGALLAMLALWSQHAPAPLRAWRAPLLAALGLAYVTAVTLRGAHHVGGVPWSTAMFSTSVVQTSLTVVWSALGVAGWIAGSRRGERGLWRAGALLMAVVLAKLVLVDREHLGNLLGIVSFLAYGLLCTAVGYFAPVPPRTTARETAS